jgi:LDH2 family malate/lactate/ureidoglycolate dehydrogenase
LISYEALSARLALILYQSGCSDRVADLLAKNCAAAERDGAYSHLVALTLLNSMKSAVPHGGRAGQTLILIDPPTGRNQLPDFAVRVAELLRAILAAGQERLPGDRRFAARERSLREGITLTDAMSATLSEIEQALRPQLTM